MVMPRGFPPAVAGLLLLAACLCPGSAAIAADPGDEIGCAVFPADNVWNTPVDHLPVDARSDAYVNTIGAGKPLHPDFGAGLWEGRPVGIPYVVVDSGQPKVKVRFLYWRESDTGRYPIPPDAPIEGNGKGDSHVIVIDKSSCRLYELYSASRKANGSWRAGSGAIFDLNSNGLRPDGWTSTDAAGLPIFPGLVRYPEVAAGVIRHALRFTAPHTRADYVWPARHFASHLNGAQYPPLGERFRLKASVDISGYSRDAQVVLQALKTYGMFLADNGSSWFLSGTPDARWSEQMIEDLKRIHGSDFEAVDEFRLRQSKGSGQVRH